MSMPGKRHHSLRGPQAGLGLIGLLVVIGFALCVAVVGMRVSPTVVEFLAAKRAIHRIVEAGTRSTGEIVKAFDEMSAIDDISSITGRDLRIERAGPIVTLRFAYEKRIPLFGRASLLLQYDATASSN
ncbi:MAG: DUF4845 domain-containing protein [Burkholderiales bacterium]